MAKPKNKTVGRCPCRVSGCAEIADVRRRKDHERGARYLDCPAHGVQGAFGKQQQLLDDWIDKNFISLESEPEPVPEPVLEISESIPEPVAAEKPVKTLEPAEEVREQKPKKSGFFSGANAELNELFS